MATKNSIHLSIPTPCSESWDSMTPEGRGRHCSSCSKTVVDFTVMSDRELLRFFKTAGDHACGRLSPGQVNREIYEAGISKPHWQRWVFGGVLALLTAGTAKSETINEPPVRMEQFPIVKGGDIVADDSHEDTTGRYVEGYVYDAETKAPLEFCYVRIEGAGIGTSTDTNGYFRIELPDSLRRRTFVLSTHYVAYSSRFIEVTPESLNQKIEVYVNASPMILGEIVRPSPRERAWRRIVNVCRPR